VIIRSVQWSFLANVWGQPVGPIFKVQELLTLEDGNDWLSRNFGKELPLYAA